MTVKENNDLQKLKMKLFFASFLTLFSIVIAMGLISFFFADEIHFISQWVLEKFGFFFLVLIVFVSDTFISPVPPDVVLLIIAASSLADHWFIYVGVIALTSLIAGYTAWMIGTFLSRRKWMPQFLEKMANEQGESIKKYGMWAIILGALTPLPFSMTCMSAGVLRMDIKTFSKGVFWRVPRVFIYYWVIKSAELAPLYTNM